MDGLVSIIGFIEKNLIDLENAMESTQEQGKELASEIGKLKSEGKEIPEFMNYDMKTAICLREWQYNYGEKLNKFLVESKQLYVEWCKQKEKAGILNKSKLKKIYADAANFIELGKAYLGNFSNVFDGSYSKLIAGDEVRAEAMQLMSRRLAAASKARGDFNLPAWNK